MHRLAYLLLEANRGQIKMVRIASIGTVGMVATAYFTALAALI